MLLSRDFLNSWPDPVASCEKPQDRPLAHLVVITMGLCFLPVHVCVCTHHREFFRSVEMPAKRSLGGWTTRLLFFPCSRRLTFSFFSATSTSWSLSTGCRLETCLLPNSFSFFRRVSFFLVSFVALFLVTKKEPFLLLCVRTEPPEPGSLGDALDKELNGKAPNQRSRVQHIETSVHVSVRLGSSAYICLCICLYTSVHLHRHIRSSQWYVQTGIARCHGEPLRLGESATTRKREGKEQEEEGRLSGWRRCCV